MASARCLISAQCSSHAAVRRAAALRAVEVDHGVVGRRLLRREAVQRRQVLEVDRGGAASVFPRRRHGRRRRRSRSRSRPRRRRPRPIGDGPLPSQALHLGARPDRASNIRRRRRARLFSISNSKPGISSAWSINAANGANSAGGDGRCALAPGAERRPVHLHRRTAASAFLGRLRAPKKEDAPS